MSTLIVAGILTVACYAALQWEWRQIPKRVKRAERAEFVARMIAVGAAVEQAAQAFGGLRAPLERAGAAFRQLGVALGEVEVVDGATGGLRGPTPSLVIYDEIADF